MTARLRLLTWALALAGALSAVAPAVGLPFQDGFELGNLTTWCPVIGACISRSTLAAELQGSVDGQTVPICVPTTTGSYSGINYTLCSTGTCQDGVTAGCAVTAHVVNATVDPSTLAGSFTLSLDSTSFDLLVGAPPFIPTQLCGLSVSNGTGTASTIMVVAPVCTAGLLGIASATASVVADADLAITTCPSAATFNAVLPIVKPNLVNLFQLDAAAMVQSALMTGSQGLWICSP